MQRKRERSPLRRRLLFGFKTGLFLTVFDFLFFFLLLDGVRETTLGVLSTLMEPLLLVTPLVISGICLILFWIIPDRH